VLAVPDVAKVKSYHVCELNGFIYMWYHAEGIEPSWCVPELEEVTRGEWVFRGRSEHYINAHIEVRHNNELECRCSTANLLIYPISDYLLVQKRIVQNVRKMCVNAMKIVILHNHCTLIVYALPCNQRK